MSIGGSANRLVWHSAIRQVKSIELGGWAILRCCQSVQANILAKQSEFSQNKFLQNRNVSLRKSAETITEIIPYQCSVYLQMHLVPKRVIRLRGGTPGVLLHLETVLGPVSQTL